MAISRLGSTTGIIAALRADIGQRAERSRNSGTRAADASTRTAPGKRDVAVLRQQLADIVKGVDPDDARAVNALRPRVVRAVLLWEFGAALREHPEWQPMLETITSTLEAQPAHQAQLQQLIRELARQ